MLRSFTIMIRVMGFTLIRHSRHRAAANLARDLNFDGTIVGNVYAQPLYIEDGPGGRAMIIAATESNNVYALDAGRWERYLAAQRWPASVGRRSHMHQV